MQYPGYGPYILYKQDDYERFPGDQSVEFYTVLNDLKDVNDDIVSRDTNQRVELHVRENYQDLGVAEGAVVWIGWSHMYTHIASGYSITDFQIRSQDYGVTGSPAAEFGINGDTKRYGFGAGPDGRVTVISSLEEGVWYDFVLEFKYSLSDDGYARIWASKAGSGGEVLLVYSNVTAEILDTPTMHNGDDFPNEHADSSSDRDAVDSSPHLRWGVYPWDAQQNFPESEGVWYRKYLGPVRIYVGDNKEEAFNAVITRPSGNTPVGGPANLALGKPTTQSSRHGEADSQFAVDGNTFGGGDTWDGTLASTDNDNDEEYIELDLESASVINKIVIWNRSKNLYELDGVNILVSATPFSSTDLTTALAQPGVWSTSISSAELKNTITVPSKFGRYIRLQMPGSGYVRIAELEVFN